MIIESYAKCNVSGVIHESLFNNYNANLIEKNNQQEFEIFMNVTERYKLTSVSLIL